MVLQASSRAPEETSAPPVAIKPTAIHMPAEPFAESAAQTLDSASLNRVLRTHLHNGRIDSAGLQKDAAARKDLAAFVKAIGEMPARNRPRFHDARIHMALNCGAVFCPGLPEVAFEQGTLDGQLTVLAREVINDGHHVVWKNGQLEVSALFDWFEDDFVGEAGSVVGWIKRYAESDDLKTLPEDAPSRYRATTGGWAPRTRRFSFQATEVIV